ncbi:DUF1027 domain-containing protein [Streptococcus chenjunshii]|uniref:DUF1027 domain-containing protein n=1 Tax=Streptococcus chenjunshii TaxID=2173853 RepID=A0A372KME1_9STRE|nr:YutD-like domain-containing protein [Streptococcus chenjunshii]AXQ78179.1 DUF1027 domain-containing protein [Streptococcus chenjunshii]RFU50950.1 DUF1027 domain-containing protein [Streptococcus chenjunshii]RFU53447.1 DUF1027 domain-containing protein [Streptococcus chenjunshii]
MRKEISPEMYNYNKFPGPQFMVFADRVKSDDAEFLLLENEKNAFDPKVFSQRFSEILLKYDYIVGDWGNEQLRLKGFYKDSKPQKKGTPISRLPDYIKEYCNFGCAYFILENPQPKTAADERSHRVSSRSEAESAEHRVKSKGRHKMPSKRPFSQKRRHSQRLSDQTGEETPAKRHFVIRKKED